MRKVTFPILRRNRRVGSVVGLGATVKKAESAGKSILRSLGITKHNPAAAANRKYMRPTSKRKAAKARKRAGRSKAKRFRKLWGLK